MRSHEADAVQLDYGYGLSEIPMEDGSSERSFFNDMHDDTV